MRAIDRQSQTICALSTPAGLGALAVVRVSGREALRICRKVAVKLPEKVESHRAYLSVLINENSEQFDEALVTYFAEGRSYTGEETIEFSTHGSQTIVQELLAALVHFGARPADKGEFTYRAFLNGKIDLIQAESVLGLIESQSKASTRQSLRQLKGSLSDQLSRIESEVTWALAHIEASIDFSTEGLETESSEGLLERLKPVRVELERLVSSYQQGRQIRQGFHVALIGQPNVGKSSLLNVMLEHDRALVSDIAGTTRDFVEGQIFVKGMSVLITDTAGLRDSPDQVEKMGIERTRERGLDADLVVYVFEAPQGLGSVDFDLLKDFHKKETIFVGNKADLSEKTGLDAGKTRENLHGWGSTEDTDVLFVSTFDKTTCRNAILGAIEQKMGSLKFHEETYLIHARHHELLIRCLDRLGKGMSLVEQGLSAELAAFDLKESLLAVQEVLGKHFDDQILDRVFKEFCLGK